MFRYIIGLLLCVLLSNNTSGHIFNDTLILRNALTAYTYGVFATSTGQPYIYDPIKTVSDLNGMFGKFKYTANQFFQSGKRIRCGEISDFYRSYQNFRESRTDTIKALSFSIENVASEPAYAYFMERDNTDSVALFIIPGSNPNQSHQIYFKSNSLYDDVDNYQKDIAKYTNKLGDTYIYIKPNEDALAFHDSTYKFKLNDNYLYNNLLAQGKPYSANYLLQCIAYVNYLKTKYKKVIILGCSQGGLASILVSMNTNPTATVVSTGYSVLFEDLYYAGLDQINLPGLFNIFNKDSVYKNIRSSSTEYFFSWGRGEEYAGYELENSSHLTETYFSQLSNATYFYDFDGHIFPVPQIYDFLTDVISRPGSSLKVVKTACHEDSIELKINFQGTSSGYSFALMRNDTLYGRYTIEGNNYSVFVKTAGKYQVDSVLTAEGRKGLRTHNVNVSFTPPGIDFDTLIYDATNSIGILNYKVNRGSQGFQLKFKTQRDDTVTDRVYSIESLDSSLNLAPGYYVFDSLVYKYKKNVCSIPIEYALNLPAAAIAYPAGTNCISDSVSLAVSFQGKGPFSFSLEKDGVSAPERMYRVIRDTTIAVSETGKYQVVALKGANDAPGFNSGTMEVVISGITPRIALRDSGMIRLLTPAPDNHIVWRYNGLQVNEWYDKPNVQPLLSGNYSCEIVNPVTGCILKSNVIFRQAPDYLQVFPNPADSKVTIVIDDVLGQKHEVRIFNVLGQLIRREVLADPILNLDVSSLTKGVYIINVKGVANAGFNESKKLIKR